MATESVLLKFGTTGIPRINRQLVTMQGITSSIVGSFTGLRSLLAGFVGIVGFRKVTSTLAGFEQTMANVQAVSGATKSEFEALEKTARDLGATTVFSSRDASQGLVFLSQAGFSATESIKGLPEVLKLAQAGGLGLAEASKITANVIRGMNLEVSEGARINDVFAKAAASSNVTVASLGQSFSFVAPFANALGVSIEQATTAIGKLGDAGLTGGRAGRNMVAFFRQLAKVTPEAERILSKYGLTAEDINVKTLGLNQVLQNLQPLVKNVGDTFRIFGAQGALVANILGNNVEGFDELNNKLNESEGSATKMARIMSNTLTGSFKAFISAVTESTLQLGDSGLTQALTSILKVTAGVISEFNGMGQLFRENTVLTQQHNEAITSITQTLRFFGERIGIVIDAFKEIASLGFRNIIIGIGTAFGGATLLAKGFLGTFNLIKSSFLRFAPTLIFIGLVEAINQAGKSLNAFAKTDISTLQSAINGIRSLFVKLGQEISNLFSREKVTKTLGEIFTELNRIDQATINEGILKPLQDSSFSLLKNFREVKQDVSSITSQFKALENPTSIQVNNFNQIKDAIKEGEVASKRLLEVQRQLQQNTSNVNAFRELKDEAVELENKIRESNSRVKILRTSLVSLQETKAVVKSVGDEVQSLSGDIASGIGEGFRRATQDGTGFLGILESVTNALNNFTSKLIESALEQQLLSFFSTGASGVTQGSGLLRSLSKTGGQSGSSLSKPNISSGLGRSLSKTVNNYYNQGLQNKTGSTQVRIYDQRSNTSAPVQTQRSVDNEGNVQLKILIKDQVNSAIQEGGLDSSLDSRFGVKPLGI